MVIALGSSAQGDASTAEALFTEAQTAYDQHDYATAIAKWQESYRLSNEVGLLFDIAQAMRLSGDCRGALQSYHRFIEGAPADQTDQIAMAQGFVRELESSCNEPPTVSKITIEPKTLEAVAAQPLLDQAQARREEAARRRSQHLKIIGLELGGAGAVAIAAGLALGHHGAVLGDEVTRACVVSCSWAAEKGVDAAGRGDVAAGYAIDGVGGAAIVGGGIAYYLGLRNVRIEPHDNGAVLSLKGNL